MRSWRKTVNVLLIAIIVLATVILLWTNWFYNREDRRTVVEENTGTLALWTQWVDAGLDSAYEHVRELIVTVYNNTELRSGSPMMQALARNAVLDSMTDKLRVSENIDCFFVLDTDADMLLYSASSELSGFHAQEIKSAVRDLAAGCATSIDDRNWALRFVGERLCFVKAVTVGKYRVGAVCGAENYEILNGFTVLGGGPSLLLVSDGGIYFAGGEGDRSGELTVDENGEVRGSGLAVISHRMKRMDAVAVLAAKTGGFFSAEHLPAILLIAVSALFLALILLFNRTMQRQIVKPTHQLLTANNEISAGDIQYRITEQAESQEFKDLFDSFNNMAEQILSLRIEAYDRLLEDRENKLRLLRAQIKPHFYLNAITTISNMTYQGRSEDIRGFCSALAKYMRYMLGVQSDWTTVDEELTHIANYVKLQRYRSAGDLNIEIDCPDEIGRTRIPLLVMFTVVENTFKHAMSLTNQLTVSIRGRRVEEPGFSGCSIVIEDDGDGFPEKIIEFMNAPAEGALPAKEHLGLSNVRYTMALLFNRQGLLRLSNRPSGGASVEIRIPDAGEEEGQA